MDYRASYSNRWREVKAGTPLDYLKANPETILAELIEFASIPSVSIDLAFEEVVIRTAEWVAGQLRTTGVFEPQIIETSGSPVVYGEWIARIFHEGGRCIIDRIKISTGYAVY